MKIISCADIHGRRIWQKIVEQEPEFDKFIFTGDYFDSREAISVNVQIANFLQILEFKNQYPDKVTLLLGNHDFHYLDSAGEDYSGYNWMRHGDINAVLQPAVNAGLVQICHVHDNFIFTHAGLTKTWVEENEIDINDLENQLNTRLRDDLRCFRFSVGANMDYSGDDVTQGPIWVRIPSLLRDKLDGYTFVVGHTPVKELTILGDIIATDTLGTSKEYLVLEDNVPKINKIILE